MELCSLCAATLRLHVSGVCAVYLRIMTWMSGLIVLLQSVRRISACLWWGSVTGELLRLLQPVCRLTQRLGQSVTLSLSDMKQNLLVGVVSPLSLTCSVCDPQQTSWVSANAINSVSLSRGNDWNMSFSPGNPKRWNTAFIFGAEVSAFWLLARFGRFSPEHFACLQLHINEKKKCNRGISAEAALWLAQQIYFSLYSFVFTRTTESFVKCVFCDDQRIYRCFY